MHNNRHIVKRERILTSAEELFLKYGYSKSTMDEIASEAGVSKKTLYTCFLTKEELMRELILKMGSTAKDKIDDIFSEKETNFIEKLRLLLDFIRTQYSKFDGPLLTDLHKNIPDLWEQINGYTEVNVKSYIIELLETETKKEIITKDLNRELVSVMLLSTLEKLTKYKDSINTRLSSEQVLESILKIIFSGIFTNEGRIKYDAYCSTI